MKRERESLDGAFLTSLLKLLESGQRSKPCDVPPSYVVVRAFVVHAVFSGQRCPTAGLIFIT